MVFDAFEQFKREHPEWEQNMDIARQAMEFYRRYLDNVKPQPIYITITTNTSGMVFKTCSRCGGTGIIQTDRTYPWATCPMCQGQRGFWVQEIR